MRLDRRRKIALGAGATGLVAVAGTVAYFALRDTRGKIVCPASPLVESGDIDAGDFVVVQLGTSDGTFNEPTWGRVKGRWLSGGWRVQLVGEIGKGSANAEPLVLSTDRHGYEIGQILHIGADCLWDRYRPLGGQAQLVCGPGLDAVPPDTVPRVPDPRAKALREGDAAALVVAAGGRPVEMVWVRVLGVSAGSQVLTGEIVEPTQHEDLHGLAQGAKIEFVRDCVVDVDMGGE